MEEYSQKPEDKARHKLINPNLKKAGWEIQSYKNANVQVMNPKPGMKIHDPACGTGGFLLSAYNYIVKNNKLNRDEKEELKHKTFSGNEIVPMAARLCVMNLYLHGVNGIENPISPDDSLKKNPGAIYNMILTNPPFGKASSETIITEEGETARQNLTIVRDDFWAKTSNKQLNFLSGPADKISRICKSCLLSRIRVFLAHLN